MSGSLSAVHCRRTGDADRRRKLLPLRKNRQSQEFTAGLSGGIVLSYKHPLVIPEYVHFFKGGFYGVDIIGIAHL